MKHTQGPWKIDEKRKDTWIIYGWPNRDEIGYMVEYPICELGYIGGDAEANAHLIAAAPDLLEVCRCALADLEGIMPEYESSGDRTDPAWQTIRKLKQAIAKAEGRDK